jgi:hypothetical protein
MKKLNGAYCCVGFKGGHAALGSLSGSTVQEAA